MWQRPPRGRADQLKQFDDKLYVYLGGGSLTSANTDLAHGVVRRCKTWAMAMTVLIAARFLSLCVPGEMMSLRNSEGADSRADAGGGGRGGRGLGPAGGQRLRQARAESIRVLCKTGHGEALEAGNVIGVQRAALRATQDWAKGGQSHCGPRDKK